MVEKYALYSGALIKIAGSGHIDGAYVSAKDYHKLESENARLRAENERLFKTLRFFESVIRSGEDWTETCEQMKNESLDLSNRLRAEVERLNDEIKDLNLELRLSNARLRFEPLPNDNMIHEESEVRRLYAEIKRLNALLQEHQTYTPKQSIKEQP